jgi:hypothetical protein
MQSFWTNCRSQSERMSGGIDCYAKRLGIRPGSGALLADGLVRIGRRRRERNCFDCSRRWHLTDAGSWLLRNVFLGNRLDAYDEFGSSGTWANCSASRAG